MFEEAVFPGPATETDTIAMLHVKHSKAQCCMIVFWATVELYSELKVGVPVVGNIHR
jgi:hypothetical protein